jgi:hypothetical protein
MCAAAPFSAVLSWRLGRWLEKIVWQGEILKLSQH